MSDKKTTYPVNEVLGFCISAKQLLTGKKTEMIAQGVDPTAMIAKLQTDHDDLFAQNSSQEDLKTQLRMQTETVDASNTQAYMDGSNACDLVISAYGRTSQQAKEAINLRKSVRPVTRKAKTDPDTPPPTP